MKPSLQKIKNRIKLEPRILLKRPWLLFVIPIIISVIIYYRLRRSETVVYLTETKLSELLENTKETSIPDSIFRIITEYKKFLDYASKRIIDDSVLNDFLLDVIKRRFDRGDYAIIYLDPFLNPLSYLFICTKIAEFTPVGIDLPLPARTFGIYDVYTFRNQRGQGYYTHLFWYTVKIMKKKGYDKIWLWLMAHNTMSVKVHKKLGITRIIKILTEKLNFGVSQRIVMDVEMPLDELKING